VVVVEVLGVLLLQVIQEDLEAETQDIVDHLAEQLRHNQSPLLILLMEMLVDGELFMEQEEVVVPVEQELPVKQLIMVVQVEQDGHLIHFPHLLLHQLFLPRFNLDGLLL
jgi:hypothetical protein